MIIPFTRREIPRWIILDFTKDALYGVFFYGMIIALGKVAEVFNGS